MQLFGLKIRREKRTEAVSEEVVDADLSTIKDLRRHKRQG